MNVFYNSWKATVNTEPSSLSMIPESLISYFPISVYRFLFFEIFFTPLSDKPLFIIKGKTFHSYVYLHFF